MNGYLSYFYGPAYADESWDEFADHQLDHDPTPAQEATRKLSILDQLVNVLDVPHEIADRMVTEADSFHPGLRSYKGLSVVRLTDGHLGIAIGGWCG